MRPREAVVRMRTAGADTATLFPDTFRNGMGVARVAQPHGQRLKRALGEVMERETGLEPATPTLARSCSTS